MSPPLDPPPFPFPWIALRDPPDICCARRGHASVPSPGALPPATVYPLRVNHHEEPQLLPTVVQPERRGPQRTESARAARFFLSARGRSGAARHGAASPARSTGGHRRADANKARPEPADAPRSVEAARHAARDAPPRGNHGVRGEGVRRFGGIIPGHRQRHEGNCEVRFPRDLCCVFTAFVSVSGASSPHTEPPPTCFPLSYLHNVQQVRARGNGLPQHSGPRACLFTTQELMEAPAGRDGAQKSRLNISEMTSSRGSESCSS